MPRNENTEIEQKIMQYLFITTGWVFSHQSCHNQGWVESQEQEGTQKAQVKLKDWFIKRKQKECQGTKNSTYKKHKPQEKTQGGSPGRIIN